MEKCLHVSKIRPAWDHSILNPEKWLCYLCRTTESVWACLSCSNVACGRFNEKHALKHYQESKHPISIEVNEKYVYCYACDDYVLNDNAAGDIKLLRSALSAIATQKFTDIESRGRRLLRSYSYSGAVQRDEPYDDDKIATAEWHRRQRLLSKVFNSWRLFIQQEKSRKRRSYDKQLVQLMSSASTVFKKRSITPGVTGLKNLGNTCYMNSVLQVLSHIDAFRDFFLKMKYSFEASSDGSPLVKSVVAPKPAVVTPAAAKQYARQTTVECFQHLMSTGGQKQTTPKKKLKGGLNGGSAQSTSSPVRQQLICDVESQGNQDNNVSLSGELHGLFRVLWSGKWAQVSPHAFLRAVWQAIPMFKGYAQHDAQEFLCELLDKIQRELDGTPNQPSSQLLDSLFQGQLVSRVQCQACRNVTETLEPYMDLSLEFPNRYQITKQNSRVAEDICHITEMLAKFTEEEHLEGNIYACEKCNKGRSKSGTVYTEAKKQLLINELPPILRLHLKRFRWSGRIHREKISTHVATDELLDLKPFCSNNIDPQPQYRLFGVIIHHGRGFGSGHYTAYTWNKEAESWVHCNDSRMILSTVKEVLTAQAYILFYKAEVPEKVEKPVSLTSDCSTETVEYSLKSEDTVCYPDVEGYNDAPVLTSSVSSPKSSPMPKLSSVQSLASSQSSFSSLPTLSPSPSLWSITSHEKYSLKSDGTEILSDDDIKDLESSSISDKSVHVIDREITFNFKPADNMRVTRSSKRSLDNCDMQLSAQNLKRAKKLSFETSSFYSKPRSKTPEKQKVDLNRRRTRSMKNENNSSLLKLEKYIGRSHANDDNDSAEHIKRRKSTFW
ncbi:ubiquitin carboxyl-terminal hydrolase 44-like [Mercenaria mercenaria]|uniref:ubiquitin carboxyl-terminal hydrolase 44-like n=1 Tax=Mercenaria mercenaria TaxID=6596 RepID=UPI00234E5A23|nr:ubiquitin carboxyl-terminal hydrolase 44-like [Mercenaria mercenaria]XP_045175244.2 ubiquitin carboxyl-terminal hydrolase 44-like [Mercenaria mercenaria]